MKFKKTINYVSTCVQLLQCRKKNPDIKSISISLSGLCGVLLRQIRKSLLLVRKNEKRRFLAGPIRN